MATYSISKAGNLVTTMKYAVKLKSEGFCVVLLSPGLVDTTGTIGEHGSDLLSFSCALALADSVTVQAMRQEKPYLTSG